MDTYKPSGKFSPLSFVILIVSSLSLVPLLSWLYVLVSTGLMSVGIVFFYLNFIVTLIFGTSVGLLVMHLAVIDWGKVRNAKVATVFSLLAGLMAYYWHWVFWLNRNYYTEDNWFDIFINPQAVLLAVNELNEMGTFTLEKNVVNGFLLFIVWLIEAVLIIWPIVFVAKRRSERPFSEKSNKWSNEIKLNPLKYIEKAEYQRLLEQDFSPLLQLKLASDESHHCMITLYDCFDGEWYVSIIDKYANKDDKGKVKFEETELLSYVKIDAETAAYLQHPDKNNPPTTVTKEANDTTSASESYQNLYDTEKTKIIVELLKAPNDSRNEAWERAFYSSILNASFTCGDPQIRQGPNGLPYFFLQYPESKKPFNPYSLLSIKDHLLSNGYGVALSPDGKQVIWSIPHGAMVNLHLNGELFSLAEQGQLPEREVLTEPTQVLMAEPSEEYLPKVTREVIKDFLQSSGIAEPKVALSMREYNGEMISELIFNIHEEDFETEEQLLGFMNQLKWFLPGHYVVTLLPKKPEFVKNLIPL